MRTPAEIVEHPPRIEAGAPFVCLDEQAIKVLQDESFNAGVIVGEEKGMREQFDRAVKPIWRDGCPDKLHGKEWFVAVLDNGDRLVLRSLPEEYSYDYTTADESYFKAFRIKKWMQFPDSHFADYDWKPPILSAAEKVGKG